MGKETQEQAGARAALFPALAEGQKEKRAVSILLACLEQVPELAQTLLSGQGVPLGKRSRVECHTEAGPSGKKGRVRPDGRIEVRSGAGRMWTGFVEAKIGKAGLDDDQIEGYLQQGNAEGVQALITVSNDFTILPTHHPTYQGKRRKNVALLHWSWCSILTKCRLLTEGGEIEDRNHRWVVEHLVRFLSHSSTGVTRFEQMPPSWKELVRNIKAGASLKKTDAMTVEAAGGWIQEIRDLGLQLTDLLHQPVPLKLSRAEREDPQVFAASITERLCSELALEAEYLIPDGVSALRIRADLRAKTLTTDMTVGAPEDRKTAKARTNWLLRQLTETKEEGVHVKACYAGRRGDLQASLGDVREKPEVLSHEDRKACPGRYEVKLIADLGRRMEGVKTFVQALEEHVPAFYTEVGQHLQRWVPAAPKVPGTTKTEGRNGEMEGTAPASRQPGASSAGVDEREPHRRAQGHDAAGTEPDVGSDV